MTPRGLRYATLACLACAIALAEARCKKEVPTPPPPRGAPLGILFAGWYGFDHKTGECVGGLGSTHWNDGPNTGGIVHTPLKLEGEASAFYCSADPVRVAYQLDRMEDAGIKLLLFSWWGWGDTNLDGTVEGHPDQWINRALLAILKQLKERGSPIKVAILIEPFTYTQAGLPPRKLLPHQLQMVLEYLYANFYRPYRDQMFGYEGNPLVATFDPMVMPRVEITTPTRIGDVDWWPRAREVTVELVPADAQVSVENQHVRVAVATTTRASDVVALVGSSRLAAPLLGATLADGATGQGIIASVAETPLTHTATFRWTVRQLSSQDRSAETDAQGWNWWLVPQQPPSTTLSSDGVVFLNHRFSEYYLHMAGATYITWQWRDIDPMLSQGVYERQWQWALDHRDEIRLLLLYSWNFYGELAQLEPSTLGPAPPEQEYLARTKRYERRFQDGAKSLEP